MKLGNNEEEYALGWKEGRQHAEENLPCKFQEDHSYFAIGYRYGYNNEGGKDDCPKKISPRKRKKGEGDAGVTANI